MEKHTRSTDSKSWLKVVVLLLALLVSPVFMAYGYGTIVYISALFIVSPPIFTFQGSGYDFALVPLELIFLVLVESLPSVFFFIRINAASRTGSIKRLITMSVVTTIILGTFLPFVWPLRLQLGLNYYYFSYIVYGYPTVALVGLVLIPAFVRESSFLLPLDTEARENSVPAPLSNRMASIRFARTLGLVIGVVTFIVPSAAIVYTSNYSYQATFVNVIGYLGISMNYGYVGASAISIYYYVYGVTALLLTLAISSVRIVFARKLVLYLRGIGGVRRLVAIGFIGESLAFFIYVFPTLFLSMYSPQPQSYPLPFLLVLGLVMIRLRDSLTSVAVKSEVVVQPLSRDVNVWPLSFEEEGAAIGTAPSQRPQYVRVPVAYVIVSRLRRRRSSDR